MRRSWTRIPRIAAACIAALACAGCAAYGSGSDGTDHAVHAQHAVRFTEMQLLPEEVRIDPGGIVVWTNQADHSSAVVVLPVATVSQLSCDDLRPRFGEIAGGAYQSIVIEPNGEDLVLPCPLKAGSHDYEVRLFQFDYGSPDAPLRTLKGRIVAG